MTLTLDDLPTFEDARRRGRSRAVDSALADTYRIQSNPIVDAVGSLGMTKMLDLAGRAQQRLFPSATDLGALQAAAARGPGYTTYLDCGPFTTGSCEEPCFGFAPHQMDPLFCASCSEQRADPDNNPPEFWHFVGSRGQHRLMDREPDICAGQDAWKWNVGPCGSCARSATFRCHDGYKQYAGSTTWTSTICEGKIECDGVAVTCP